MGHDRDPTREHDQEVVSERDGSSGLTADATPEVLRSFVNAVPTATLAVDPETHAIGATNAAAAELFDRDRGTLRLMGVEDLAETSTTATGDPIDAALDAALAADGVTRFEWTVSSTPTRRLELAVRAATIADRTWLIVGLTDVTDRVTAQQELRSQRRIVDAVASTLPAAMFTCCARGTLSRWNVRLADDLGYGGERLSGTALASLFDEESRDAVTDSLQTVYEEGATAECEATLVTNAGEHVPYRLSLGALLDGDEVVGAIGIGQDITDASLREERLAVLTRVLRHNFRNDLNVVTGFTERAIAAIDDPTLVRELQRVVDTAERLLRVGETSRRVEQLLADRPTAEPIDLSTAVAEAMTQLPSEHHERADIDIDVPPGITVSAVDYLAEAVAELIDNAIRHSNAATPHVAITAAELPSESWTSLVVADDGPGIPPAERAVLTGEETPLEHGSGLGLWYVKWIVAAGGGTFDISDSKRGGTRIEIELQAAADA